MKKTRLMSMLCAIAMSLTLVLPVGAANIPTSGKFVSTLNGQACSIVIEVRDIDGNLIPTPYLLPFDGTGSIVLPSGATATIHDTGSMPFELANNLRIYFSVTLASPGTIDFGYQVNGTDYMPFSGMLPATQFDGNFKTVAGGSTYFRLHNASTHNITITALHIA